LYYSPLFGFEVTKKIELERFTVHPVYTDVSELKKHYISNQGSPCTAIIETEELDRQLFFWLEIILTVADKRSSKISHCVSARSVEEALDKARIERMEFDRPSGPGKLILGDSFSTNSRKDFLRLALEAVFNTSAPTQVEFCQLLHKTALCYMGGAADFIENKFFFLFSGLEALARKEQNKFDGNAASPITNFICSHGFDFSQERKAEPFQQALTYTTLRNACFHNGELEAFCKATQETYKLSRFYAPFERLVGLLILKHIGFDDGRVNWNSWLDRMPFK
jgi:hypothetical protein